MIKSLLTIFSLFLFLNSYGQLATETIDANNIKTYLGANGSLHFDPETNEGFEVAISNDIFLSTIFASGLWIAATDAAGEANGTYVTYPSQVRPGFTNGPINAADLNLSFDKVWKVTRQEIEDHIAVFAQNGSVISPSSNIDQWPSSGNTFYDPALPSDQELAPFYDQNNNGVYEPREGDYPIIGNDMFNIFPDQLLFTIFNSNAFLMNPLEDVEIHATMYAFDCDTDDALANTIFTRHRIFNNSMETYTNFRAALWHDPDIGCYVDDYIGCDTLLDMSFFYNGDPIDGSDQGICPGGTNTFGDQPPVHSTVMLNQKMRSFIGIYNAGVGTPDPNVTDPSTPTEYYNVMKGLFRSGFPMTKGQIGFNPGSIDTTEFAFFSDPKESMGWSMYTANITTLDVRSVMSTGLEEFLPGDMFTLDMAHIYTRDLDSDHIETVTIAKENVMDIQQLYDEQFAGSCGILSKTRNLSMSEIKVYPNPSSGLVTLGLYADFNRYSILDASGNLIFKGDLDPLYKKTVYIENKGLYLLLIKNDITGETALSKFIIH